MTDQDNSDDILSAVKVTREGYGDLAFQNLSDWDNAWYTIEYKRPPGAHEGEEYGEDGDDEEDAKPHFPMSDAQIIVDSHNLPVVELDFFVRNGVFSFFGLPFEIRERIYLLILGPFFDLSEDGEENHKNMIPVTVVASRETDVPNIYDSNFDDYILGRAHYGRDFMWKYYHDTIDLKIPVMSPDVREEKSALFRLKQAAYKKHTAPHPDRSMLYYMETFPKRKSGRGYGNWTDYLMITLVRAMSNISKMMRLEFSAVLWKHTYFKPLGDYRASIAFIRERPVACSHITAMGFRFIDCRNKPADSSTVLNFRQLCSHVASSFKLEILSVDLSISDRNIEKFVKGEGSFAINSALRPIHVSQNFKFSLNVPGTYIPNGDWDAEDRRLRGLHEKYYPIIRDVLLPNSLRPVRTKTAEEEYLVSRMALVGVVAESRK